MIAYLPKCVTVTQILFFFLITPNVLHKYFTKNGFKTVCYNYFNKKNSFKTVCYNYFNKKNSFKTVC
ncbi:MAG: hypothetical protein EAZ95_13330 [Bacteroidetes bacterium]|nr:MAG: hypothetical protein EAZ95_13330 [Bacteroidota bacterium]